jgi:4-amino-4-deoxy-L-arabinose transferase-like glycosyltransferase
MEWLPLKKFDESRLAVNAIEMLQTNNFLTTYYEGFPDMWSTKPPLLIWMQALSIKCFGMNEFSTRFPSALAALMICIILLWISIYIFKIWEIGVFSILVLITSQGFVNMHGSRSGDYDTLLTLFLFINGIAFYLYTKNQNNRFALAFFSSLILGAMTKGIAGFFFMPIYLLYLIGVKKVRIIFNWNIVLGLLISILIILSYYFIRESENPGYMTKVIENELGGRYLKTLESHSHPFSFYFLNLIEVRFLTWFFLAIIGLFTSSNLSKGADFVRFCFFVGFSFLFIISFSQTKLIWYDMPIYPFLAIVAASGIFHIYKLIQKPLLAYSFILCLFAIPYLTIFSQVYVPRFSPEESKDYRLCEYIRENKKQLSKIGDLHINWVSYNSQNLFYAYSVKELNPNVRFNSDIKLGDKVLLYQDEVELNLKKKFNMKLISYSEKYSAKIYEICGD